MINAQNEFGQTPLSLASHNGSLQIIRHLIENGANVNKFRTTNEPRNRLNFNDRNEEIVGDYGGGTREVEETTLKITERTTEIPLIPSCTGKEKNSGFT